MRTNEFDPLAYIESAFLDRSETESAQVEVKDDENSLDVAIPTISSYLNGSRSNGSATALKPSPALKTEPVVTVEQVEPRQEPTVKFRKTLMSAPRPRRAKKSSPDQPQIDASVQSLWEGLPKNMEFLFGFFDDSVTANYYRGEFKESRQDLIRRLLDPELSLEETSRLLGVCPATVRRYTNRKWLTHHRTTGGQRRFRLSDIVKFVEVHGRFPEA